MLAKGATVPISSTCQVVPPFTVMTGAELSGKTSVMKTFKVCSADQSVPSLACTLISYQVFPFSWNGAPSSKSRGPFTRTTQRPSAMCWSLKRPPDESVIR